MSITINKEQLIKEINLIPYNKLSEVFNFLHSYRLGVEKTNTDITSSWDKEINDRLSAIKSGELSGLNYDLAMKNLNNELS